MLGADGKLDVSKAARSVAGVLASQLDARTRFRDLSRIPPGERVAASPIVQFYSSVDNIGNYLPVLGIHKMLGTSPDVWHAHDPDIDFDFINGHYQGVIIGGAGLFHASFDRFWRRFVAECDLPAIIWGVGLCAPDRDTSFGVDRSLIKHNASRFDLVNVRDDWTAEYYGLTAACVTACPTVVSVADVSPKEKRSGTLVVSHKALIGHDLDLAMKSAVKSITRSVRFTDNIQRRTRGIQRILRNDYARSELVATSRLHGAIIAYGLRIPYVAFARDEKVRVFQRQFGHGELVESIGELKARVANGPFELKLTSLTDVLAFGKTARTWISSSCSVD